MSRWDEGFHYQISHYGYLMACANRMDAFVEALRQTVTEQSVVVDLGAGTGVFALLACRFGARRVYAIDPNDAIAVAEEIGAANGFSDRLVCIQDRSTAIELPERADVIVSDLRGMVPLFEQHIPTIVDARERFLKPGGSLIPRRDKIWAAVVEAEEPYSELLEPWEDDRLGIDMSAGRRYVVNDGRTYEFSPEHLLTEPQVWAELDYTTIIEPDVEGGLHWTAKRVGTAHGVALWFESELADGVSYQTGPEHLDGMHRCKWLCFSQPVDLDVDDLVSVKLGARFLDGDYLWRWQTEVTPGGGSDRFKAKLDQSDFLAVPRGRETLRRGNALHVPELGRDGEIDRFILESIDGIADLETIALSVAERFPDSFTSLENALAQVAKLSLRYGK